MTRHGYRTLGLILCLGALAGCGDDDTTPVSSAGPGGSAGQAGSAGGVSGSSGQSGAGQSGSAGQGGAGSGGAGGSEAGAGGGEAGGDAGAGGEAGQGGEGGGGNQAPTWSEAPATLTVREGETLKVPFAPVDPEGDAVAATVSAGDGWQATIEDGNLVVHGRFDGADASTLTIDLDDGNGGLTTVAIPVTVGRMAWQPTVKLASQDIEAREHPVLLQDDARQRVLILGGSGYKPYGTPLGGMYAVSLADGVAQTLAPEGDVPGPAASRRAARVPGQSAAYIFGGYGEQNANNNDLFRLDFTDETPSFTKLTQENPPSPRSLHMLAFEPQSGKLFVFGGVSQTGFRYNDLHEGTIEGDQVTWKKLTVAGDKPTARYGFFYGVDQDRGVAYVFSGAQKLSPLDPARDLWQLDLRADPPVWTLLLEGEAVPEGRRNGAFAYDDARDLFYVWGGTPDGKTSSPGLWVYDARPGVASWFEIARPDAPPIRSSGVGVVGADSTLRMGFGNTTSAVYSDLTALGF